LENDDLFQIGAIGLIKCIKKFDTSFNVKFSTYAVPMIIGEIKRFLRDDGMIKISRSLKELAIKAKFTSDKLTKEKGREATIDEIASELNAESGDIIMALEADRCVESIYNPIFDTSDSNQATLSDRLISSDSTEDSVNSIFISQLLETLSKREQSILKLRYFADKTQTEIADKIGISQVQVSRIEKKALLKLRGCAGESL
jgi:RNA polymerase sporulation-specific sigma factor